MKQGSTLFLKVVLFCMGIPVLGPERAHGPTLGGSADTGHTPTGRRRGHPDDVRPRRD